MREIWICNQIVEIDGTMSDLKMLQEIGKDYLRMTVLKRQREEGGRRVGIVECTPAREAQRGAHYVRGKPPEFHFTYPTTHCLLCSHDHKSFTDMEPSEQ